MTRYHVTIDDQEFDVGIEYTPERFKATINGRSCEISRHQLGEHRALLVIDNESLEVDVHQGNSNGDRIVFMKGMEIAASIEDYQLAQMRKTAGISHHPGMEISLRAPMPGLVVEVKVAAGEQVAKGQHLVIIEAMKMENIIKAKGAGTVKSISVSAGRSVEKGDLLLEFC